MPLSFTCEQTSRLPDHLRGSLPADEERTLVAHLDGCQVCQQCLEQLAIDEHGELLTTARHVGDVPAAAQPHLRRLVARLGRQSLIDTLPQEPVPDYEAATFDFLDPPLDPSHLGRLEHYEVIELIAQGGMGIVLKAIDEKLGRIVCLKVLSPHIAASPTARKRFIREARAAAAVHSPQVVPIHAVCESRNLIYLVLEYVSGQSLQHRISEQGPLPIDEVIRLGHDIATGLAAVHALGLVHRDVKPGNVLIDQATCLARLTDFGLARAADDTSITREGIVGGTPEYMSPEQARGRAVDHRSDLFSLGSVLYAMCTGRLPFEADGSLATLKRICEDAPPAVETLRADVPAGLSDLVGQLLSKQPQDRIQSAAEVARLLADWRALDQSRARPRHVLPMLATDGRSSWKARLAAGAVALTVLLCAAGLWQVVIRIKGRDGQETTIRPHAGATVEIERGGQQVASVTDDSSDPPFRTLAGHRGPVWNVAFAADRAVTAGEDHWVRVWDLKSGKEVQRFDGHMNIVYALAISSDGKRALSGSGCRILGKVEDIAWSVCWWEIETGKELHRLEGRGPGITSVALSRDGSRALIGAFDGVVRLWDVSEWREIRQFRFPRGLWSICFSPDETRALTAGGDGGEACVRLWNLEDGAEVRRFVGHKFGAWHAVFLPDGRSLLSAGQDETMRHWETDTGRQLGMFRHQGQVTRIATTADGRLALAGAWVNNEQHNLRLFQLAEPSEVYVFQGHRTALNAVALSPDGRTALVGGADGTVRLWTIPAQASAKPAPINIHPK